jgi:hypothetical protein
MECTKKMTEQFLQNAFLFRQPILNRQQELAGYQLSFRSSEEVGDDDAAPPTPGAAAPLCAAYSELGMQQRPGQCQRLHRHRLPTSCSRKRSNCCHRKGVVLELLLDGVPDGRH